MKKPLIQRVRTLIIDASIAAMNWVSENTHRDIETGREITRLDRVGWWLEARLSSIFAAGYHGSDEELLAVYHGEIPPYAMNERQRAVLNEEWDYAAHCCYCRWAGLFSDCVADECPACGEHIWIEGWDDEDSAALEARQ